MTRNSGKVDGGNGNAKGKYIAEGEGSTSGSSRHKGVQPAFAFPLFVVPTITPTSSTNPGKDAVARPPVTLLPDKVLKMVLPLLPSINRKGRIRLDRSTGQTRYYTSPGYKAREQRLIGRVKNYVAKRNWSVSEADRYSVEIELYFKTELKSDLDGPAKATLDCLQLGKGGAIWNDNRIKLIYLIKSVAGPGERTRAMVKVIKL